MSLNIINTFLFLSFFSITYQKKWNIEMLLYVTYENMTKKRIHYHIVLWLLMGYFQKKNIYNFKKIYNNYSIK